jgi:Protein of unknown function (DUF3224)
MKIRVKLNWIVAAGTALIAGLAVIALAAPQQAGANLQEKGTAMQASGSFDVKLTPQEADKNDTSGIAKMTIDKQYHGDLEGTGTGVMLAAGNPSKGSGGYVAMEKVTGTLKGRSGGFTLQHKGVLNHGATELSVTVVPDSGTEQLAGLAGEMKIEITNGKHFYKFDYTLPEVPAAK